MDLPTVSGYPARDFDPRLVSGAASGETTALSTLLESVRPTVYQWALHRVRDPDDAEDVTQTVLLRVCKGISTFRGQSKLSSWLFRITANESVGLLRRDARRGSFTALRAVDECMALNEPSEPDRIYASQACCQIRRVARALPPLQLAAFQLVDLDGLKPCEAAEALGRTQANVRSSLCRARKRIRELVRQARRELAENRLSGARSNSAP